MQSPQSQNQLVELLTPPSEETQVAEEDQPSSEEREELITSILEQNDSRIKRLEQTLQREKAKELTQLEQQASQSGEDTTESQTQLEEKYSYAEELRQQALKDKSIWQNHFPPSKSASFTI